MNPATIAVAALLIESVTLIVACVWVVANIRQQTALVRMSLDHLAASVTRLEVVVEALDRKSDKHADRIARLEEHVPRVPKL